VAFNLFVEDAQAIAARFQGWDLPEAGEASGRSLPRASGGAGSEDRAVDDELGELPSFDRGLLRAHRLGARLSSDQLRRVLARARRDRANLLTRLLCPGRRRYLDGLLRNLEWELERRAAGGERGQAPGR
jgi:hypothetical protein